MRKPVLAFFLIIGLALSACNNEQKVTQRAGEPDVFAVEQEDQDMNTAISKANQHIDEFKEALSSKDTSITSLGLKVRFNAPAGGEHIWLTDVFYKDGSFYGVVNNEPVNTQEVALGDTVKVQNGRISDWMYIAKGKLRGGYSIRVIRDRMSEAEKKQFDTESGFMVD